MWLMVINNGWIITHVNVKPDCQWVDLREHLQGNHRFSHEAWDFPVIFHLNQSIEVGGDWNMTGLFFHKYS